MVFVSLPFLLMFFPLCMIFYIFAKDIKAKNIVLLVFSLTFYAWGEPKYVVLLLLMTVVDWFAAICIEKYAATKKFYLIAATIINLGLIGVFKYGTFFLKNTQNLFGFPENIPNIALPIGISFYTFQLLSYVIDVYRGDVAAQKKFHIVLLYASLFHQCIAGPIVRYKDVEAQLLVRSTNLQRINGGINRFCVGLAKKAVFANMCGKLVEEFIISDANLLSETAVATVSSKTAVSLWLGMLMYALQIYLDFSAYSDMAIGLGKVFGFHFLENFNYPFISKSATEFWRRWHMSLGSWFRDYLYIPLGGNRVSKGRHIINIFAVWLFTGFWHGASWNFILWGVFFGVLLLIEKFWLLKALNKSVVLSRFYILLAALLSFVVFQIPTLTEAFSYIGGMFGAGSIPFVSAEFVYYLRSFAVVLMIGMIGATPLPKTIVLKLRANEKARKVLNIIEPVFLLGLLIVMTAYLVDGSFNPFLYFRF